MRQRYIYLIFTKTGTWLARSISTISRMRHPHASLGLDSSFTKMYSFGRTNPDNPFSGGFVEENLYGGVYKKYSHSECMIYKIPVTESQYGALQKQVKEFLYNKTKYRYNFTGLFRVLLNRPLKKPYHYFCSQFVSEVLIKSNIISTNKVPELIKPDELLLYFPDKELIYEGPIRENRPPLDPVEVASSMVKEAN
jgi:hypothetical protein